MKGRVLFNSFNWKLILLLFILSVTNLVYGQKYKLINLGTLGGNSSEAFCINNSGQIVGTSSDANGQGKGFLYQNGNMEDLGGNMTLAYGINSSGEVVGIVYNNQTFTATACLWENGNITELGTLGGNSSTAFSINNSGNSDKKYFYFLQFELNM